LLAGRVLLRVEDLLRRRRRVLERIVDPLPAAGLEALHEREARGVREEERLAEHRWHLLEAAGDLRVQGLPDQLEQLALAQVVDLPERHHQRRVALDEREAGDPAIALADLVEVEALEVEVLVLQRVRVFVGERRLLGRAEVAGSRHDVELLVVGAVQAGDLAAEELDVQVLQVRIPRQQAEALEQPLVRGDELLRVVLAEPVRGQLLDACVVEDHRVDGVLRLEAADRPDLLLDSGIGRSQVDRPGGGRGGRRRGGRRGGRRRRRRRRAGCGRRGRRLASGDGKDDGCHRGDRATAEGRCRVRGHWRDCHMG
jgi:hypothetical protein